MRPRRVVAAHRSRSEVVVLTLALEEARASERSEVMAAVDLGSNSFHMVVARLHHGQLAIIDRLKEMVRLAAGLQDDGMLDEASRSRALACLGRFGERLRDMHADTVRVVGTNTLRKTRSRQDFLEAAEAALGHPVDVITGIEEARLIYSGVAHHSPAVDGRRLVVDIGGGSTEVIIGAGNEPRYLESVSLGCVRMTRTAFADDRFSPGHFATARMSIRLALSPFAAAYRRVGWNKAIGSSGTIRAAQRIAHHLGLSDGTLTPAAVETIIERIVAARRLSKLSLPGLSEERAPVFAGGIAILGGVMDSLGIAEMTVSDGALREGLLYDMLGTAQDEDAHIRTVRAFEGRFHVDRIQADRVEATALKLFDAAAGGWGLADPRCRMLLRWAARLHEIGLDIAHSRYHLHSGYLLENAEMPGFVLLEQDILAALVRFHRRKLDAFSVEGLPERWRTRIRHMLVLLRLAVLLNRTRSPVDIPEIDLQADADALALTFPIGWLSANALTSASLVEECELLAGIGFELRVTERATS
ncbi:MAG: exopolyphosphatase [Gammaproteobacteria bacterium]